MVFSGCSLINLVLISCVIGVTYGIDGGKRAQTRCKEVVLATHSDSPIYWIRDDGLDQTSLSIASDERVTHFETRFAIKADRSVNIELTNNRNFSDSNITYTINLGTVVPPNDIYSSLSQWTRADGSTTIKRVATPCILTATKFREFFLNFDNGKLEFGVVGSTPLLSHDDPNFELINYFQFRYGWSNRANIRYDCPLTC